jgi:hypothetical protein
VDTSELLKVAFVEQCDEHKGVSIFPSSKVVSLPLNMPNAWDIQQTKQMKM